MITNDIPEIPPKVLDLIDRPQYKQKNEFEIEMGYVYNTMASVHNGNRLFWEKNVAYELAGANVAPPTMLSVWFRPHYWAPGFENERTALQTHFDLKRMLALPEAIIASNESVFGVPVKMRDRLTSWQVLRSVSEVKRTRVGIGRFWVINVECVNQENEYIGTDIYTCFGYKRSKQ